jgi:predicted dehydrogenase
MDVTSCFDRYKPTEPSADLWKERGGEYNDALYNLGSHMIDQAIVLFGKPTRIFCRSWPQRGVEGLDEAVSWTQVAGSPRADDTVHHGPRIPSPTWITFTFDRHHSSFPILSHLASSTIPGPRNARCIRQTWLGSSGSVLESRWKSEDSRIDR